MGCIKNIQNKEVKFNSQLETELEYKQRWRSIYIIYLTMFMMSLGFSIIVTGVWPYLDKLDPNAGKEFMGYIVAANPFAQMLFSPLVGFWCNKLNGNIRIPLLATLALFVISSAIYSSLELFDSYHKYWMLFSRFLVGISSANVAACRAHLSAATTLSERNQAVSMISLAQVIGFIIGPAIQAAVVPLGDTGSFFLGFIQLNMYTAAGWISVLFCIANFILFLPSFFQDHRISKKEAMLNQGAKTEEEFHKTSPNYFSAWTLIVVFFVLCFNFMLLETLGTSLIMDQFAWTKAMALKNMGIFMSVGGVVSIVCFALINPLCKKFPEVKVMIWGGFLFMVLGRAAHIPWGDDPPLIYDDTLKLNATFCNDNQILRNDTSNCIAELVGCPSSQKWCFYTRSMTLFQFILGFALTTVGYPIGVTLIQIIFSKVLGSKPQGVWMGLLTSAGCLSRVLGPVFVTYIYTEFGTNWTFGFTAVMMVVSTIWLICFHDKVSVKPVEIEPQAKELLDIKHTENNANDI